jgi:fructose-1,6-bisphosphatase II
VLVLDRPRHADLIRQIREAGARIRMISDGDVGGAIETAKPGAPVDVLMGARGLACICVFALVGGGEMARVGVCCGLGRKRLSS